MVRKIDMSHQGCSVCVCVCVTVLDLSEHLAAGQYDAILRFSQCYCKAFHKFDCNHLGYILWCVSQFAAVAGFFPS